jgi:hypothetical protein
MYIVGICNCYSKHSTHVLEVGPQPTKKKREKKCTGKLCFFFLPVFSRLSYFVYLIDTMRRRSKYKSARPIITFACAALVLVAGAITLGARALSTHDDMLVRKWSEGAPGSALRQISGSGGVARRS